jgi:prepilin-type N-terminal cleavage/methylation domain-containing protein
MSYTSSQFKKGFTLLETLIAIAVLTVAVGAAFGIAQKSLQSSAFSKNQTTAFFLASESLELVRTIRDNTALYNSANDANIDWLMPFKKACNPGSPSLNCTFDIDPAANDLTIDAAGGLNTPSAIRNDCGNAGCRLKIDSTSGTTYFTSISPSTANSLFSRKIQISELPYADGTNKKDAVVTVTIYWLGEDFTISETITNWN